jgi:hypothetical protein
MAVAGFLFWVRPAPVIADTQVFPVPSVSTSRNDGNDVGLIAPILITDPDGELRYLMAPMFIQNSIVGSRGVFNLFRYWPGGRQMQFIGSFTERIERKLFFNYADPAFNNGQYSLNFGGTFFKNATSRFFGIGQTTPESAESNYTAREARAYWRFGVHANEVTQIAVGQRVRQVRLERGATDLPFSVSQFPNVDGMQGESIIIGHRATFLYDTRDNLITPTDGIAVSAYAEIKKFEERRSSRLLAIRDRGQETHSERIQTGHSRSAGRPASDVGNRGSVLRAIVLGRTKQSSRVWNGPLHRQTPGGLQHRRADPCAADEDCRGDGGSRSRSVPRHGPGVQFVQGRQL